MRPLFGHELAAHVHVALRQHIGHSLGDFLHALERLDDWRFTSPIVVEHGVDRLAGNPALTRVDDETTTLELRAYAFAQRNRAHVDAAGTETETERAAVRR